MKGNKLLALVVGAGFLLWGVVLPAQAAFELRFDTSATGPGIDITIVDNGAGDLNPLLGAITFAGALAGGFIVNVTTVIGEPILPAGGVLGLELDLNSVNVQGAGSGALTIQTSQDGLPLAPGAYELVSTVGGVVTAPTGSSASFQQWLGAGLFSPVLSAGPQGPFGPGAFSNTATVAFSTACATPPCLLSLTDQAVLSFSGPGSVSFNLDNTVPVPTPATALLIGLGLVVGSVWSARRR